MHKLPNFLVVGAEKAGTTSLALTLSKHPEIFMPEVKELRFFSEHNWDKGLDWYTSHFAEAGDAKRLGEASPSYTWHPHHDQVPERIFKTLGEDIQLIYLVRHPVDRLVSHYRHALYNDWLPHSTTIVEAIKEMPQLKICSLYYFQIEQYLPHTHPTQWLVLPLEYLKQDPNSYYKRVFEFLDVDPTVEPEIQVSNVTNSKVYLPPVVKKVLSVPTGGILGGKGKKAIRGALNSVMGKSISLPEVTREMRIQLFHEYEHDIEKLSEFAGFDFNSIWTE